jgi:hypothetical protein
MMTTDEETSSNDDASQKVSDLEDRSLAPDLCRWPPEPLEALTRIGGSDGREVNGVARLGQVSIGAPMVLAREDIAPVSG